MRIFIFATSLYIMNLTSFYVLLGPHLQLSKTPLTISSPLLVHEGAHTNIEVVHVTTLHFTHQYPNQDYMFVLSRILATITVETRAHLIKNHFKVMFMLPVISLPP